MPDSTQPNAPPPPPRPEAPPGYILIRLLGQGGFAEVWEARRPDGLFSALKFIDPSRLSKLRDLSAELRELEIMLQIREHVLIVRPIGFFKNSSTVIIEMPVASATLDDVFKSFRANGSRGIPPVELIKHMLQAANAIDYLNSPQHTISGQDKQSIIHRDIKPSNFLLFEGGIRLADFGIARFQEPGSESETLSGFTPDFSSPEVNDGFPSLYSDQYSLAVTYFYLRTGRFPFERTSLVDKLKAHKYDAPNLSPLPPKERPIIARALAKEPSDRWPNCLELIERLEEVLPCPVPPNDQTVPQPEFHKNGRFSTKWLGVALFTVLIGLAIAIVTLFPRKPSALPELVEIKLNEKINLSLAKIDPGKFLMGSSRQERDQFRKGFEELSLDDEGEHEVTLDKPLYVSRYEVTQDQFAAVMGRELNQSEFQPSARRPGLSQFLTGSFPVERVTFEEAMSFCRILTQRDELHRKFRLPTEAEWEYACRTGPASKSGEPSAFAYGQRLTPDNANCDHSSQDDRKDSFVGRPQPVGSYPANRWGLYDMHGNVAEWCLDFYCRDILRRSQNPCVSDSVEDQRHVVRGGSWFDPSIFCRSAHRDARPANERNYRIGFRIVMEP